MKALKLTAFAAAFCAFGAQSAHAQAPTDNPYKTTYNISAVHWTDSLKWTTVIDVTTFGAVPNDNQDDHAAITAGIADLSQRGGGVLYFPPGLFNSSETIKLKSGVILRGATIPPGANDPMQTSFNPPSGIWFPKYVFDTLANGGAGTDNSTAFKLVDCEYGSKNIGVIDLDINRAVIKFQPEYVNKPGFSTPQPQNEIRNVVVMGVRSNNAVLPEPNVPTSTQKPWQRFPWRFSTNVDIVVAANAIVAKCRMNDGVPKDNFMMENYLIQQRNTTNMLSLPLSRDPLFDYDAHYGISVNRKKTFFNTATNKWGIAGYVTYANPTNEPSLFAPGIEILDNWIFKTNRVAIIAAGTGLKINRNKMYDDPTKPSRPNFLGPVGTVTPQGATTFENRGLDFSGWAVEIDSNYVEAYRHQAGGYLSTDGEGILLQECCGGTAVNDYVITRNIMAVGNYIGIYKMRDINNVNISNNDLGGGPIWVWANTNGASYYLNGTYIANNTNVSGISLNGDLGGVNCVVTGNQGRGSSGMNVACHVDVRNDNSGFNATVYNSNGGQPCLPNAVYPQAIIVGQGSDSSFCASSSGSAVYPVLVIVKMTNGDPATANGTVMLNGVTVVNSLTFDPIDSTARVIVDLPNQNGTYQLTATVSFGGLTTYSRIKTYTQNCTITGLKDAVLQSVKLYPNPTTGILNINADAGTDYSVEVISVHGKVVKAVKHLNGPSQLNLSDMAKGIYHVVISSGGARSHQRVVVE